VAEENSYIYCMDYAIIIHVLQYKSAESKKKKEKTKGVRIRVFE
jgi:hypothetical protein